MHNSCAVLDKVDPNSGTLRNFRQNSLLFEGVFVPHPGCLSCLWVKHNDDNGIAFQKRNDPESFLKCSNQNYWFWNWAISSGTKEVVYYRIRICLLFSTLQITLYTNVFKCIFIQHIQNVHPSKSASPISQPHASRLFPPLFHWYGGHLNAVFSVKMLSFEQYTHVSCKFELCKF